MAALRHPSLDVLAVFALGACGRVGFEPVGDGDAPTFEDAVAQLTVGHAHACVRSVTGELACWGSNSSGQIGDGKQGDNVEVPTPAATITAWIDVSAGQEHTCALDGDGAAWCWGSSSNGQLGLGDTASHSTPTRLGDRAYTSIHAGSRHTCARATDGSLWCWGRNGACQLGLGNCGSGSDRRVPEQVTIVAPQTGSDTGWSLAGPGDDHSCALQQDGRVFCMGANGNGQLGQGLSNVVREWPGAVVRQALSPFVGVGAGRDYSCAITDDGIVETWGRNDSGQLGHGDRMDRDTPVARTGGPYDRLSCGVVHACARRTDGILECWGNNSDGQLGNGSRMTTDVAVPVAGDGWAEVGAGTSFTCAVDDEQRVWCWGSNSNGRLGTGTGQPSNVPVPIADASTSRR